MAVSFKVPKSPKRSIFTIDNFLGVDLTNTGANIDDVRSPNAENMIRYVPGKVRKRMGYEKDVLFGKDVNVNYAIGTSSKEKEIVVNLSDVNQWIKIYDLIKKMVSKDGNAFDIYFEFDYMSEDDFSITQSSYVATASPDEWSHYSEVRHNSGTGYLNWIAIKSLVEQRIYIKNFSVMYGKDASYSWSPAPNYFVERANNDPVYGVHIGKTGIYEGNRVVNVNRVLSTTDSFETFNVTTSWQTIKTLADYIARGIKLYIEFDYRLTGDDVWVWAGGASFGKITASSTTAHFSGSATNNGSYYVNSVQIKSDGTTTLEISNLSIMYDIDSTTYDWHEAPEDAGGKFPLGDVYLVGSKNYAISDSYDDSSFADSTTHQLDKRFAIEDATSKVEGFTHISFDLHTASFNTDLNKIEIWFVNNGNYATKVAESNTHFNSEHFDFYVPAGSNANDYIQYVGVVYKFNTGAGNCWTYISNIQANETTPRSSYDISPKWYIYHVGSDFYLRASNSSDFTRVYTNANQHLSKSWQFNKKLYILDGKNIYSYAIGEETVTPIDAENGYIPTLTIAKSPTGGGIAYEPLNMLQPGFIELFQGTAAAVLYYLSFGNLDSTIIKAWTLNSGGGWDEKVEGTDFDVNRGAGFVRFFTAPGTSPITGEDNIKILAYRTVPGYRERITNCTNGTLFGVGGAEDRLFLTGNPDYPNWDFYSEQYDPSYFPDTGYSALGSEASAIVGYALVNNYLAAFKDGGDLTQAAFIREGDLVVEEKSYGDATLQVSTPAFKLINTLQGHGVIAPYAFGTLQTEPVFLTKSGIFAITAQDITGEKYSQNRSFYLNGKLTEENNLEDAVATVYNDMYILAINNQLYILDGLQATRTDRSEPYATRQYVGFHCTGVPAVCIWNDDALFFGTGDGKICRFHTDVDSLDSYNDDGKAIYSCWETPDLDGQLFYKNKTFRYFAIRMMKALRTSVKMYTQKLGTWSAEPVKEDTASGVVFDFENIDFELFSFSTDRSEKVVHTKIRVKKADKARFKVVNENLDEPFGLFDLALEYIESGNYKG